MAFRESKDILEKSHSIPENPENPQAYVILAKRTESRCMDPHSLRPLRGLRSFGFSF